MTKAELDNFKPGRGLPSCVLEARPLCEDFPQLLHQIILNGIKSPYNKVILSYMPSQGKRYSQLIKMVLLYLFVMHTDYPSGAATPRTTQNQLSSSTIGQQAKIGRSKLVESCVHT